MTDRATAGASPASIAEHLSLAKRDIASGDKSFQSAAEHIAAAIALGSTQRDAAATVGKSVAWINRVLKWKDSGFAASGPFTEDNKQKRRRAFSQTKHQTAFSQTKHSKSEARAKADQAKAEAAKAKAEAAKARHKADEERVKARAAREKIKAERAKRFREAFFGREPETLEINKADRDKLVKALGMLGSDHDGEVLNAARMVERLRRKLGTTWEILVVKASETNARKAA
jgi:hypothetical protein